MFTVQDGILALFLKTTVVELAEHILPLIRLIHSMRSHTRWSGLIPFVVPSYGDGASLGHCIAVDFVIAEDGAYVTELDYVPSGRGWILSGIPDVGRRLSFLDSFRDWYESLGISRVYYATASKTLCHEETVLFADALRERGIDIHAVNIDECEKPHAETLVDRLFYRSEMERLEVYGGYEVITKEPYLDSKMFFALLHDPATESLLVEWFGKQAFGFLQRVFPKTYVLAELRQEQPDFLRDIVWSGKRDGHMVVNRYQWLVKSTDVETDYCWGSRGVILGCKYNNGVFADLVLRGMNPRGKYAGALPILQRYHASVDWASLWEAARLGLVNQASGLGGSVDQTVLSKSPTTTVAGRVRVFLLVDRVHEQVIIPSFGEITLRQDPLAHGASNSMFIPFELT